VETDLVGECAGEFGDDGAAEDGSDEEAGTLAGERAEIPRVKMEGNMMELQKPTARRANIAKWP
jgi:hypothetical protein